ncbi:MAG: CoA pyrophosphatase [Chloroflexota bacterium]
MESLVCDEALRTRIKHNLHQFEQQSHDSQGLKQAAVAITVVEIQHDPQLYDMPYQERWNHEAAIVLTQRASKLRKHAGQWALPGGRMDAGETPEQTALRELEEEVGLTLGEEHVLGRLDDFTTRSGFVMTPVVIWGGADIVLTPNPEEVASVHRIPLREFMRQDSPQLHNIPESDNPVLLMLIGHAWIAAPTGALIYQFREVAIRGELETRVAHYEQPFFAWR